MQKHIRVLPLTLGCALFAYGVAPQADPQLGGRDIAEPSVPPGAYRLEVVQGGFDRSFKEQPPMVPHEVDKYNIDLRENGCLKCHSEATAAKENTKPTPESHFLDRDGNKLETLSGLRYFCSQCHTAQVDSTPLVANTFEGRR